MTRNGASRYIATKMPEVGPGYSPPDLDIASRAAHKSPGTMYHLNQHLEVDIIDPSLANHWVLVVPSEGRVLMRPTHMVHVMLVRV